MTRAIPVQCSTNWSLPYSFLNLQYIWNQRNDQLPVGLLSQLVERGTFGQCTDHWTTEQSRGVGVPAVQLTHMSKVAPCTVARSYIQIFSAWWVTILYNYGATLGELRYYIVLLLFTHFTVLLKQINFKMTLSFCFSGALRKARWRRRHNLLQSSTRDKLQRIDLKLPVHSVISTGHVVWGKNKALMTI